MARVAAAIFEALPADKEMRAFDEVADTRGCDLLFAGLDARETRAAPEVEAGCTLAVFMKVSGPGGEAAAAGEATSTFEFADCDQETLGRAKLFARQVLEGMHGVKATGCA